MECRARIEPPLLILLAASALLLSLKWVLAWLAAMLIHELCHIAAVRLFDYKLYNISFGIRGARIRCETMRPVHAVICAAAGPTGSLFLLAFSRLFPTLAICGAVQGVFNLIPVYPLDGGSILRITLQRFPCPLADGVENGVRILVWSVLSVFCFAISKHTYRIIPLLILWGIFSVERKISLQKGR